jgi:hypothetical protein
MPATLGRNGVLTGLTGLSNDAIRSVTYTNEAESIDITCRQNASDGFRAFRMSFVNPTIEVETLDIGTLAVGASVGTEYQVTNISENQPLDDVVSYTITLKRKSS